MVGRTQREEAKAYVRDVIERATREALRVDGRKSSIENGSPGRTLELLLHESVAERTVGRTGGGVHAAAAVGTGSHHLCHGVRDRRCDDSGS
jgi:hypothetical protein